MNKRTCQAILGGLLHDVGRLCQRIDSRLDHSSAGAQAVSEHCVSASASSDIIDCIRYHYSDKLNDVQLKPDAAAYAVCIADSIAVGADRRADGSGVQASEDTDGLHRPLASVFDTMQGTNKGFYEAKPFTADATVYPSEYSSTLADADKYKALLEAFLDKLEDIPLCEEYANSLLSLTECCFSNIPATTSFGQRADVSLFDHVKLTAGIAGCITEYLIDNNTADWSGLLADSEGFLSKKAFLLYSADLSGIQSFIYSIVSKGAMKSLKSRSLSLELLMENHIDELLDGCGLCRTNLIYSGGGHCYILLPNTEKVKTTVAKLDKATNRWLGERFGNALYLASGYVEACAYELMNDIEWANGAAPLKELFIRLSRSLGDRKLHRYDADDIRRLNSDIGGHTRECKNCARSSALTDKNDICETCRAFIDISRRIIRRDMMMLVTEEKPETPCLELPSLSGSVYMSFISEKEVQEHLGHERPTVRIYSKNRPYSAYRYSRNILIGDYVFDSEGNLETLADKGEGIERIAVLRADVDNLGASFISGFERGSDEIRERYRYDTLSRKATFSRQMSVFFRCCINTLLDGSSASYSLSGAEGRKKVTLVYSGGDDLFLVGAWSDVISSAIHIRDCFIRYCGGALTLSAGIGIFDVKYPILRSARITGELEDAAKALPNKDAAALFTPELTFKWTVLRDSILGEKYATVAALVSESRVEAAIGKAALYKLLSLLRAADERINLARLAYQLSRLAPRGKENNIRFTKAVRDIYSWALDNEDRSQLIAAVYIYVYMTRE